MENNHKEFGTGAQPSPRDPRDYVFKAPAQLPPFDWELGFDIELLLGYRAVCLTEAEFWGVRGRSGWGVERYREIVKEVAERQIPRLLLKPNDQNGSGSCTGQSSSKYLSVLDFIETGVWDESSAHDMYSHISIGMNQGAYLRSAPDRARNDGNAKEMLVPSLENGNPPSEKFIFTKPADTPEIIQSRIRGKALSYLSVNQGNIDEIAWAILLNFGVYFGVAGTWEGEWSSAFPRPPKPGESQWYHALWAGKAKLINGKKKVSHLNSWGAGVGEQGWQWLGEEYYTNQYGGVFEAWTIQDQPNQPDNMKSNSKIIKLIYPDGTTAIAVADPATKPAGLISMTRNRGIDIPLKPDSHGEANNDIDWAKLKIDGEVHVGSGSALDLENQPES